jgi:hypothetical protein
VIIVDAQIHVLRRIHEAFGARRLLGGTDYSRLPREWILGRATAEWVGCPG